MSSDPASTESTISDRAESPETSVETSSESAVVSEKSESPETSVETSGESAVSGNLSENHLNLQVRFKTREDGKLLLFLPPESENKEGNPQPALGWNDIWQQLKHRLNSGDRFWQPNTPVHLMAHDRLLDVRQLQAIAEALSDVKLELRRIYTTRRQTAVTAATAGYSVEQRTTLAAFNPSNVPTGKALADPLYLETTLRSGVEIRHAGNVTIVGDVNPGGSIIADGDILVWGRLRGVAQAGANGNERCIIMALQMEPTQIRIADRVARAPEAPPEFYPEVAYVVAEGIRIARAADFSKAQMLAKSSG